MTTIAILPEMDNLYRALAGDVESTGRTAGEALDALTSQLPRDERSRLVILQSHAPDKFFDAAQQERLTALMRLRQAGSLSSEEDGELEGLVEAEINASRLRAERATAVRRERHLEEMLSGLTSRESHLLRLLVEGLSTEEIAEQLNEDLEAVRYDLHNLRAKIRHHFFRGGGTGEFAA